MEELHRYGLLSIACAIVLALTFTFRDREADAPLKPKPIHEKRDIAMAFEGGDDATANAPTAKGEDSETAPTGAPTSGDSAAAEGGGRKLEQHASGTPKEIGMKAPVESGANGKPDGSAKPSKSPAATPSTETKSEVAAKDAVPQKQEAAVGNEYVVQSGDTLMKIARAKLGDGKRWPEIVAANPSVNKGLKPGAKLKIPVASKQPTENAKAAKESTKATKPEKPEKTAVIAADPKTGSDAKVKPTAKKHTVAAGDTLSSIARTHYGDAMAWKKIYEANKSKMKSATDIRKGMVLNLP